MGIIFGIVSESFPLIIFVMICLNALIWWVRGRHTRREFPERVSSYKRLIAWFVGYSALLCGLLQLELMTTNKSIFDFFPPDSLGAYGVAVTIFTFGISPLLGLYIYKFNGAEELTKHPGLLNGSKSPFVEVMIWKVLPFLIFASHLIFLIRMMNF